jgi:hypothetical protein
MCLYGKNILLQNQQANFNPWVKGILNCSNKWKLVFFKGEIITKNQKWGGVITIFFSRTTEP